MRLQPSAYSTSKGRPSWSPDNQRVVVQLKDKVEIHDKDQGLVSADVLALDSPTSSPSFSPDGEKLTFTSYNRGTKKWEISVAKSDGSEARVVAEHGRFPNWSPDGESIAYSGYTADRLNTKLALVKADGSQDGLISDVNVSQGIAWKPDNSSVAYEAVDTSGYQLRLNIPGGEDRVLTTGLQGEFRDSNPQWSPSGRTIAFERRHKQFPAAQLWSVDPQTGLEKQLFNKWSDVIDPTYSPDGQTLVFGSNHGKGNIDLFEMDLDTLNVHRLTDLPGDEHSPSFSPNGETLAFVHSDKRSRTTELLFQDLS